MKLPPRSDVITATLAEIVARLGGEIRGDGATPINRIATLENACKGSIAFLSNPKYRKQLTLTQASAVIVASEFAVGSPVSCIVTPQPYLYFARLAQWLHPLTKAAPGIDATATSHSGLPESASVAAGARIGVGVKLGNGVTVGAACVIGDGVEIGDDSVLHASVTLCAGTRLGKRAIVHSGAVLGADGFGYAREADGSWIKIPQSGGVLVGDDVEIGANTCIDRGAIEDTVIGNGVKLDNLIQIAHNVHIDDHTAIAACVGIAGSTTIGKRCTIAGASAILGHLDIADDVNISFATVVTRSIAKPGTYTGIVPAVAHGDWLHNYAHIRHLDEMAAKIRSLEKRLSDMEK